MQTVRIRELIDRYHCAINRKDWVLLADVFAEDAAWRALEPVNLAFDGRPAILEGLRASVLRQQLLVQNCAGVVITRTDEHTASVQSTLMEFGRENGAERGWAAVGFYDDLVRLDGDTWRFVERTLTVRYMGDVDLSGQVFESGRAS